MIPHRPIQESLDLLEWVRGSFEALRLAAARPIRKHAPNSQTRIPSPAHSHARAPAQTHSRAPSLLLSLSPTHEHTQHTGVRKAGVLEE